MILSLHEDGSRSRGALFKYCSIKVPGLIIFSTGKLQMFHDLNKNQSYQLKDTPIFLLSYQACREILSMYEPLLIPNIHYSQ